MTACFSGETFQQCLIGLLGEGQRMEPGTMLREMAKDVIKDPLPLSAAGLLPLRYIDHAVGQKHHMGIVITATGPEVLGGGLQSTPDVGVLPR